MNDPATREWTVASAVIEAGSLASQHTGSLAVPDDAVLLVENLRRNGTSDWTPPGGVVDDGEHPLDGLAREVVEETGLQVTDWSGLLYEILAEAPDLGWVLRVEVHRAASVEGSVDIGADPDGIVIGSAWAPTPQCAELLGDAHLWVREPLMDWLAQRWVEPRSYRYRILGTSMESFRVDRA